GSVATVPQALECNPRPMRRGFEWATAEAGPRGLTSAARTAAGDHRPCAATRTSVLLCELVFGSSGAKKNRPTIESTGCHRGPPFGGRLVSGCRLRSADPRRVACQI